MRNEEKYILCEMKRSVFYAILREVYSMRNEGKYILCEMKGSVFYAK
jgi:hypothetical protein